MNEINDKGTKKIFSRIGVALCVIFLVSTVMQVVWVYGLGQLPGIGAWLTESSWGMWLGTFVPMYLIGVPVGLLIFKGIPGEAPQENKLGVGDFFVYLLISFFLMYAGNIIGGNVYDYLFPLLMSAAIYLALVMFFTYLVGKLERRLRTSER